MEESKQIEMYADIKWLVKEQKRINTSLVDHFKESDKYRREGDRNTVWRHVYKVGFLIVFTAIGYLIFGR